MNKRFFCLLTSLSFIILFLLIIHISESFPKDKTDNKDFDKVNELLEDEKSEDSDDKPPPTKKEKSKKKKKKKQEPSDQNVQSDDSSEEKSKDEKNDTEASESSNNEAANSEGTEGTEETGNESKNESTEEDVLKEPNSDIQEETVTPKKKKKTKKNEEPITNPFRSSNEITDDHVISYYLNWDPILNIGDRKIYPTVVYNAVACTKVYFDKNLYQNQKIKKVIKYEIIRRHLVDERYEFNYDEKTGLLESIDIYNKYKQLIDSIEYKVLYYKYWNSILNRGKEKLKPEELTSEIPYWIVTWRINNQGNKIVEKYQRVRDRKVIETRVCHYSSDGIFDRLDIYNEAYKLEYFWKIKKAEESDNFIIEQYEEVPVTNKKYPQLVATYLTTKKGKSISAEYYKYTPDPYKEKSFVSYKFFEIKFLENSEIWTMFNDRGFKTSQVEHIYNSNTSNRKRDLLNVLPPDQFRRFD